jgi:hypothetical protein
MDFIRLWLIGYVNPRRLVDKLQHKPAPHWGFYAQVIRATLDVLLLYLPVSLMGRVPPTPSYLSFIPTGRYYSALIWLTPLVLTAVLLLSAAVQHLALRLLGWPSDFDRIVNLVGMSALVVGTFLIPWDWAFYLLGGVDQYVLGISHLVISLWVTAIVVLGLKRNLGVPIWLGVIVNFSGLLASLPIAIMFMRSPF